MFGHTGSRLVEVNTSCQSLAHSSGSSLGDDNEAVAQALQAYNAARDGVELW